MGKFVMTPVSLSNETCMTIGLGVGVNGIPTKVVNTSGNVLGKISKPKIQAICDENNEPVANVIYVEINTRISKIPHIPFLLLSFYFDNQKLDLERTVLLIRSLKEKTDYCFTLSQSSSFKNLIKSKITIPITFLPNLLMGSMKIPY